MSDQSICKYAVFLSIVIFAFTIVSTKVTSYLNLNGTPIEFLADFDFHGLMEFDQSDMGEDGDSFFHSISNAAALNSAKESIIDQYLFFEHFTPGVHNPPPEPV